MQRVLTTASATVLLLLVAGCGSPREATRQARNDMLGCVVKHPNDWGAACSQDQAAFVHRCVKDGQTEQTCKDTALSDIKFLINR